MDLDSQTEAEDDQKGAEGDRTGAKGNKADAKDAKEAGPSGQPSKGNPHPHPHAPAGQRKQPPPTYPKPAKATGPKSQSGSSNSVFFSAKGSNPLTEEEKSFSTEDVLKKMNLNDPPPPKTAAGLNPAPPMPKAPLGQQGLMGKRIPKHGGATKDSKPTKQQRKQQQEVKVICERTEAYNYGAYTWIFARLINLKPQDA